LSHFIIINNLLLNKHVILTLILTQLHMENNKFAMI